MKRTMLTAVAMMTAWGCMNQKSSEPAAKVQPSVAQPIAQPATAQPTKGKFELAGDPAKGEVVFKQFCVSCHGDAGKGDGAAAVALNPKPADFTDPKRAGLSTDEQLYNIVKEGGQANGKSPLMASWKALLNDQQIRDAVAWVRHYSQVPH